MNIATLLLSKSGLRDAILLREILGPPRGLQAFDASVVVRCSSADCLLSRASKDAPRTAHSTAQTRLSLSREFRIVLTP